MTSMPPSDRAALDRPGNTNSLVQVGYTLSRGEVCFGGQRSESGRMALGRRERGREKGREKGEGETCEILVWLWSECGGVMCRSRCMVKQKSTTTKKCVMYTCVCVWTADRDRRGYGVNKISSPIHQPTSEYPVISYDIQFTIQICLFVCAHVLYACPSPPPPPPPLPFLVRFTHHFAKALNGWCVSSLHIPAPSTM